MKSEHKTARSIGTKILEFKNFLLYTVDMSLCFILCHQRVDTIKREMFSQKSVRRFVGDSSAFVGISRHFLIFPGGECLCLGHWLRTWRP